MKKIILLLSLIFFSACKTEEKKQFPNIIIIYADDLGYGDVSAYEMGHLATPNIDKIARNGARFTKGYASSATCTPSRYALLTGNYPWRNKQAKISTGANLIIDTLELTLPKMLKSLDYKTAIVGKWHLGLGNSEIDYNKKISPGPNEVGFDYSIIMPDTQDRVPTVYIENGLVVNLDPNDPLEVSFKNNFEGQTSGKENPELLTMKWDHGHNGTIVNGISRIGYLKGGKKAHWSDIDMADEFLTQAKNYINKVKESPFFLFYSLQQPHVPRTPHPRFEGISGMGPRGDAIVEADWAIGSLFSHLEESDLLDNTLIIISSDNGPVLNDGYVDDAVEKIGKHTPWGNLRGGKYSLFEAGTRVPFITYWKDKIKPQVSDKMVSQMDFLNSIASLLGSDTRSGDGEDLSGVFFKNSGEGRTELIIEAQSRTAYKNEDWVMIPPYPGPAVSASVNIELGNSENYQLYNLGEDINQQQNLADKEPKKLEKMKARFEQLLTNK